MLLEIIYLFFMRLDYKNVYLSINFYMFGWFERKEEIYYFIFFLESKDNYYFCVCFEVFWEVLVRDVKWGLWGCYLV